MDFFKVERRLCNLQGSCRPRRRNIFSTVAEVFHLAEGLLSGVKTGELMATGETNNNRKTTFEAHLEAPRGDTNAANGQANVLNALQDLTIPVHGGALAMVLKRLAQKKNS